MAYTKVLHETYRHGLMQPLGPMTNRTCLNSANIPGGGLMQPCLCTLLMPAELRFGLMQPMVAIATRTSRRKNLSVNALSNMALVIMVLMMADL